MVLPISLSIDELVARPIIMFYEVLVLMRFIARCMMCLVVYHTILFSPIDLYLKA